MATNDLCAELQKDIKMDVNMVRAVGTEGRMGLGYMHRLIHV